MKITKKQTIGENLLYVMVWSAIILVPVLNSLMMSELHVSWENVLIAWRKIAPYLIISSSTTASSRRGSCSSTSIGSI